MLAIINSPSRCVRRQGAGASAACLHPFPISLSSVPDGTLWRNSPCFSPMAACHGLQAGSLHGSPALAALIASVRDQTKATQEDGEIKAGALKGWYIRPSGRPFQAFFPT